MILLAIPIAAAYETDQLTHRELQLVDATDEANALMDGMLARAAARTNARTACQGGSDEIRAVLAQEIHRATSRSASVGERGILRAPGFSTYSAAVERSDSIDRFGFPHRGDIYGGLTLWNSVILTLAGPCSTVDVAGVRIGTDKFDHFLGVGYQYWRVVQRTGSPDAAIAFGNRTEWSYYGLLTSKTFSYADMRANWDGWRFYEELLGPDSVLGLGEDGCVVQRRPFDWVDWIGSEWDEVLNPPVYTRLVERGILRTLDAHREEICASRERWDGERWWEDYLAALPSPGYVGARVPERRDPWQLSALCDPERHDPLAVHPVRPRQEARAYRRAEP